MLVRCSVTVSVPVQVLSVLKKKVNCRETTNLLKESFKIQKGEESYQNIRPPVAGCSCQRQHGIGRHKFPELERKW